eukprot:XP_019920223.1 PREDICTED: uncharacterized protein LOC109617830 [Crassostrea gigas]
MKSILSGSSAAYKTQLFLKDRVKEKEDFENCSCTVLFNLIIRRNFTMKLIIVLIVACLILEATARNEEESYGDNKHGSNKHGSNNDGDNKHGSNKHGSNKRRQQTWQ